MKVLVLLKRFADSIISGTLSGIGPSMAMSDFISSMVFLNSARSGPAPNVLTGGFCMDPLLNFFEARYRKLGIAR